MADHRFARQIDPLALDCYLTLGFVPESTLYSARGEQAAARSRADVRAWRPQRHACGATGSRRSPSERRSRRVSPSSWSDWSCCSRMQFGVS